MWHNYELQMVALSFVTCAYKSLIIKSYTELWGLKVLKKL